MMVSTLPDRDGSPDKGEYRYLVAGLGNPGRGHRANRHNIGFMVIDRLADEYHVPIGKVKNKAIIGDGRIAERMVTLVKPQTYMNLSGESVGPLCRFYKIPPRNLLIVYDEIDLPFGTVRLREKGGSGGHNGMKSIIQQVGVGFPRLRLGVGRPPGRMEPAAYVLQNFSKDELPLVDEMIEQALSTIYTYLTEGIDLAMSRHNGVVDMSDHPLG